MIKCPYCGKSHYAENYYTSTCIGWTPVVKDGVRYDNDPNTHTTHCTCLECGKEFLIENGESIECEQHEEPKVVTAEVSLDTDSNPNLMPFLSLKDFKPETIINLRDDVPIFIVYNDKKYKVDIQKVLKLLAVSEELK